MIERPLATVGGLIVAPDGDIFLTRSKKWSDLYSLPGGKVEMGETREEAFRREVWEETHLKITHLEFALVQDSIFSPEFWQKRHFIMNDFIARLDPSSIKEGVILNDEAYEYRWIQPAKALTLPLHSECRLLIEWYLARINRLNRWGIIGFEDHYVDCIIGVHTNERIQEQGLYFDVKVEANFASCAASDDVKDTLDYTQLAQICTQLAQEKKYHLLETLACAIIDRFLNQFSIRWAWVRIKKLSAIPGARHALVEIEQRIER